MGRLPEAWVAPPPMRELRELVRHRAKLVALRAGCKCEVHAVLATCGVAVPMDDLFSDVGTGLLEQLRSAKRVADRPGRNIGKVVAPASRSITSTSPCAAGTCAPCTSGQQHEAIANLLVAAGSCRS
jgi:hypothetical protein